MAKRGCENGQASEASQLAGAKGRLAHAFGPRRWAYFVVKTLPLM
jgi:hypothetical protein